MTSKLGTYWSVMHRRPQDYEYFKQLQPSVFKIMDGGQPDYQFAREHLPSSLVIARDWALSEQHGDMLKDPLGTGRRHAQEWNQHQARLGFDKAKTLILGINEPHVWEPGVSEALRKYTIALCDEATVYGLRVGAMQLSVGWPANNGPDTPPDWSPFDGVDDAIRANNGALVTHEYWADQGPKENWGWWGGRALKCPWRVPIIIGECGIDFYVKDGSVPHAARGWRGRKTPEQYASELAEYTGLMSADERFFGCAVFASDFANGEWASFDIEPAYKEILAAPIPVVPALPITLPVKTHLPAVSGGDNFPRAMEFVKSWEGGYVDNPNDPGGATNKGITLATYTRWRQAHGQPVPTKDDLRAISDDEAYSIYREWYWQESGADKLPWPLALAHFDTAVNAGPGRAAEMLGKSNGDFLAYMGHLIDWYTRIPNFEHFGKAWIRRRADILIEASKA